jgi:hypothetical protein
MHGGFAAWLGTPCPWCGLPTLLHAADGCDEGGGAEPLQHDSTGPCGPVRPSPDAKEKY